MIFPDREKEQPNPKRVPHSVIFSREGGTLSFVCYLMLLWF